MLFHADEKKAYTFWQVCTHGGNQFTPGGNSFHVRCLFLHTVRTVCAHFIEFVEIHLTQNKLTMAAKMAIAINVLVG